jgi:hypothetical protein
LSSSGACKAVADLVPSALVLRFLLAPDDLARICIAIEHGLVVVGREGIQLFDCEPTQSSKPFAALRRSSKS